MIWRTLLVDCKELYNWCGGECLPPSKPIKTKKIQTDDVFILKIEKILLCFVVYILYGFK